ncbi:MAG: hypothetical protein RLZZ383_2031, partial [Pseudomonadota bacterium]
GGGARARQPDPGSSFFVDMARATGRVAPTTHGEAATPPNQAETWRRRREVTEARAPHGGAWTFGRVPTQPDGQRLSKEGRDVGGQRLQPRSDRLVVAVLPPGEAEQGSGVPSVPEALAHEGLPDDGSERPAVRCGPTVIPIETLGGHPSRRADDRIERGGGAPIEGVGARDAEVE